MYAIKIQKITDLSPAKAHISASVMGGLESKLKNLNRIYASEHSPMYTQIYTIDMNIPSFVATHLRTHKKNFIAEVVSTNRIDRNGGVKAGRETVVHMQIMCNAKVIVDMARKRLCKKASIETRQVMEGIRIELGRQGDELARFLVPSCIYRNGLCGEFECCGFNKERNLTYAMKQNDYNRLFKTSK